MAQDGLLVNLIAFNVGVEIGQFLALGLILILMNLWRTSGTYQRSAFAANAVLMCAGFVLVGYQMTGYFSQGA